MVTATYSPDLAAEQYLRQARTALHHWQFCTAHRSVWTVPARSAAPLPDRLNSNPTSLTGDTARTAGGDTRPDAENIVIPARLSSPYSSVAVRPHTNADSRGKRGWAVPPHSCQPSHHSLL